MHKPAEYIKLMRSCLAEARRLTFRLCEMGFRTEFNILSFIEAHGYFGFPCDESGKFDVGEWISRQGSPTTTTEGIALIPCFSDDKLSQERTGIDKHTPAFFGRTSQTIILHDVEIYSRVELAIFLMHEGYHAWHRLSQTLAGTPSTDTDEHQETNAWIISLNLARAAGGQAWDRIIQKEMAQLARKKTTHKQSYIPFSISEEYWPEYDVIFCPTKDPRVIACRQHLASLHANMMCWSQNSGLTPAQICHSFITAHYKRTLTNPQE